MGTPPMAIGNEGPSPPAAPAREEEIPSVPRESEKREQLERLYRHLLKAKAKILSYCLTGVPRLQKKSPPP